MPVRIAGAMPASAPATDRFTVSMTTPGTVPTTFKYAGTFEVTPGDPSPCEGVPLTDTLTGSGSHLGRFTATYPHCMNLASDTFSGTATFKRQMAICSSCPWRARLTT
jgi:hypothetical protein